MLDPLLQALREDALRCNAFLAGEDVKLTVATNFLARLKLEQGFFLGDHVLLGLLLEANQQGNACLIGQLSQRKVRLAELEQELIGSQIGSGQRHKMKLQVADDADNASRARSQRNAG